MNGVAVINKLPIRSLAAHFLHELLNVLARAQRIFGALTDQDFRTQAPGVFGQARDQARVECRYRADGGAGSSQLQASRSAEAEADRANAIAVDHRLCDKGLKR